MVTKTRPLIVWPCCIISQCRQHILAKPKGDMPIRSTDNVSHAITKRNKTKMTMVWQIYDFMLILSKQRQCGELLTKCYNLLSKSMYRFGKGKNLYLCINHEPILSGNFGMYFTTLLLMGAILGRANCSTWLLEDWITRLEGTDKGGRCYTPLQCFEWEDNSLILHYMLQCNKMHTP